MPWLDPFRDRCPTEIRALSSVRDWTTLRRSTPKRCWRLMKFCKACTTGAHWSCYAEHRLRRKSAGDRRQRRAHSAIDSEHAQPPVAREYGRRDRSRASEKRHASRAKGIKCGLRSQASVDLATRFSPLEQKRAARTRDRRLAVGGRRNERREGIRRAGGGESGRERLMPPCRPGFRAGESRLSHSPVRPLRLVGQTGKPVFRQPQNQE